MSARAASVLEGLVRGMVAEAAAESDSELLGRVLASRDERAFEALVRRHGPMVYRVCLRNAGEAGAAEDAFQATFLVLARDLSSLRNRASLASWLHGVARRVALKARAGAEARRRRERVAGRAETVPPSDPVRTEALSALDEELARLPDRWRQPLVLCYLDGRTRDEAARILGWSLGTFRRRLDEARDALASRLARRGVGLTSMAAVLLSECTASAVVPPRLLDSILTAVGKGYSPLSPGFPANVLSLTTGVSNMFMAQTKLAVAALALLVVVLGLPAGWLALSAADPPKPEKPIPSVAKLDAPIPTGDAKSLQGKWASVACEMNGQELTGKQLKDFQFDPEFTGDKFVIQFGKIKMEGTFELDTVNTSKTITLKFTDKTKNLGIYTLDGDNLRICIGSTGKARPTEFKTKPDSGHTLIEFKRVPLPATNGGKEPSARADEAREVVDRFLTAALAGDTKAARALAAPAISDKQIARFKGLAKAIPVASAYATDGPVRTSRGDDAANSGLALVVTDEIAIADGPKTEKGRVVLTLLKDDESLTTKGWLIWDIDLKDADGVEKEIKRLHEGYPKTQGGPVKNSLVPGPGKVEGGGEYDPGNISAPVVYKDLMLVLVDKNGAAAVVFTEEVDKTDKGDFNGVTFKFRYQSADGKTKSSGSGKVTEKDAADPSRIWLKAQGIALKWSRSDKGKGWVYYNPSEMSVHLANAADFEDRLERPPFDQKPYLVPQLDLSRFFRK